MKQIIPAAKGVLVLSMFLSLLVIAACEGTEPRDKVDQTVETLTGKEKVDQMKKMTKDIDKIKAIQNGRLKEAENE